MQAAKARADDFWGLRTIKIEPLQQVAAVLLCQRKFGSGLDALCNDNKTQVVCEGHDAAE